MSNEVTFADIQQDRDECHKIIERAERFKKLMKNRDFKELILEGYCKEELTRLVDSLATVDEKIKVRIQNDIDAISHFKLFLAMPERFASQAEVHLAQLSEMEATLREEELAQTEYEQEV